MDSNNFNKIFLNSVFKPTSTTVLNKRNFVQEAEIASRKKLKNNNIDSLEEQTHNLFTSLTYIVLFLNDQVDNYSVALKQDIEKRSYYKGKIKQYHKKLVKQVRYYNSLVYQMTKTQIDSFADTMSKMEEELLKHIETYKYCVSSYFLTKKIEGEINQDMSNMIVINMLCQVSNLTIQNFHSQLRKFGLKSDFFDKLNVKEVKETDFALIREMTYMLPESAANFDINEDENVFKAFKVFTNKLLYG